MKKNIPEKPQRHPEDNPNHINLQPHQSQKTNSARIPHSPALFPKNAPKNRKIAKFE